MQLISLIKDWHWLLSLPLGIFLVLGFLTPYGRIYKNEGDRKRWVGDLIQGQLEKPLSPLDGTYP